jgi:hypothetical protein
VLDEGFDPPFEIVGQVVVFEQNAIFGEKSRPCDGDD